MATEGLAVRKIIEILRLKFELERSERMIARSVGCARSTVGEYVKRAREQGLDSPEKIAALTEAELDQKLFKQATSKFGSSNPAVRSSRPLPNWSELHLELKKTGVTLELLWQEYLEDFPNGLGRTQFCEHYRSFKKKLSLVMRQDHKAGEKCFVDYSGNKIPIVDLRTGEIQMAEVFVGVLGASSYTFAHASLSQDLPSWLNSHVKMFEFFGGVTELTIPDNLKSGVTKTCRYDPELNRSYQDLADHYGTCVMPARPHHPRDKAKVEVAVLLAQRWILAVLRKKTFHSIHEINKAILVCLEKINTKKMKHVKKSRRELYEEMDRPALKPLPLKNFELAIWKKARLNIDYHLAFDDHYYSAPFQLVHAELWIRATVSTIEIFHRGARVASHLRSYIKYKATTVPEHMPKAHQAHAEWTPSRIIGWAEKFGPLCAQLVSAILESKNHPELGYRAALGVVRMEKKFGPARLEKACGKALALRSPSYRTVHTILSNHAEDIPIPGQESISKIPPPKNSTDNLRGPHYFN
jgi:transposase